jgi:tetratricopeptide (TPR) repeat protein
VAYLFLQRYDEADKCFLRAMRLDKKAPEAYNNHGFVEQTRKNYGKAIKAYKKALSLRPASPTFHYNLGAAYFGKHQFDLAAQAYHKAYELDPEIFERVSRMGIMAQTTSPDDRAAFAFMVARMYAHSGDYDHALLYLSKAMEEGYRDIKKVYSDDEFATLRTDKRFSELMSQMPQALQ